MEDVWKARVTLPGAVFVMIVGVWIWVYPDAWMPTRWPPRTDSDPQLYVDLLKAIFLGGAAIVSVGQLIDAFVSLFGTVVYRGRFDVPCVPGGGSDCVQRYVVRKAGLRSANVGPTHQADCDCRACEHAVARDRLAWILFDQHYLAKERASVHRWLKRRWSAAMGCFGVTVAAISASVIGWIVVAQADYRLLAGAAFAGLVCLFAGCRYRKDVLRSVRWIAISECGQKGDT